MSKKTDNKNILITGGAGYLASSLIDKLCKFNCCITRLDRPEALFKPLDSNICYRDVCGDIRDRSVWRNVLSDIDTIYHFAAQTSVKVSEQNPLADLEVNLVPIIHILETCHEMDIHPTILFSGTVTEFGVSESLPVNENHPDRPITIYDLHKLLSEKYLDYYVRLNVVRGCVLRLANVYGPGPRSSSNDRGILNMMIRNALQGKPLTIYGSGKFLRDYIFVNDVANAFITASEKIDVLNGRCYVIGSGKGYTITDAVQLIAERVKAKTGKQVPILYTNPAVSLSKLDQRNFVADSTAFIEATGWSVNISLLEGIDMTIDYYLKNQEIIK